MAMEAKYIIQGKDGKEREATPQEIEEIKSQKRGTIFLSAQELELLKTKRHNDCNNISESIRDIIARIKEQCKFINQSGLRLSNFNTLVLLSEMIDSYHATLSGMCDQLKPLCSEVNDMIIQIDSVINERAHNNK